MGSTVFPDEMSAIDSIELKGREMAVGTRFSSVKQSCYAQLAHDCSFATVAGTPLALRTRTTEEGELPDIFCARFGRLSLTCRGGDQEQDGSDLKHCLHREKDERLICYILI
jgi:hypothetical protein